MIKRKKVRIEMQAGLPKKYAAGFSLFELVAFIILVAIIYSVAANRFSQFPAAAERANFVAITAQIQAGISLEMMMVVVDGNTRDLKLYEDANPMDLLFRTPSNYLGAFDLVDKSRLPRRSWYFDRGRNELVYLINNATNVFFVIDDSEIPTDEIRFRTQLTFSYENIRTGSALDFSEIERDDLQESRDYRRRYRGVLVEPVTPFRWLGPTVDLPTAAISEV